MISLLPDLKLLLPELLIAATLLAVLLADLLFGGDQEYEDVRGSDTLALAGVAVALAVALLSFPSGAQSAFSGSISVEPFSQFVKVLLLLSALFGVLFSYQTPEVATIRRAEYAIYTLGLLLAAMIVASANDILVFYLSFEMLGLCSYILAGHMRGSQRSSEAGFKYVLYGAACSGVMLYGLTFLYGLAGSTNLPEIFGAVARFASHGLGHAAGQVSQHPVEISVALLPLPILMVVAGMLYKVAAFPLHFWCPDVYEGSATPVTAIFSVLVKITGFAALLRFLHGMAVHLGRIDGLDMGVHLSSLTALIGAVSAMTMIVGNLGALNQTNVKRLLAYSGIAQAGYLLMGVAVLPTRGLAGLDSDGSFAVLFFLAVYLFSNLGVFVVAIAVADHLGKEDIEDFSGLGRAMPFVGSAMAVCLFALIGAPPTAGFIGKFYLFYAVVKNQLYWLALIGLINSAVSVFYYAKLLRIMFFRPAPEDAEIDISVHYKILLAFLTVPVLVLGVHFRPLVAVAKHAAAAILSF